MKIKSTLLIILIFLVTNCGFNPIYSSKGSNFKINEIELIQKNKLNSTIKNNLSNYSNEEGNKEFNIKISSQKEIGIGSKDSKGNAKILIMYINVNIEIIQKNGIIFKKLFSENFSYSNNENKFDLKQYEKSIEKNLTNKIIENINTYLFSL
jgi:hypothetical protein